MEGGRKANKPLAAELAALRERVHELEALRAGRAAIAAAFSPTPNGFLGIHHRDIGDQSTFQRSRPGNTQAGDP